LTMSDPRVAQPYVIRSYLAPERNSGAQEKAAALTFLAELLGGNGTTSLMARSLQFGDAPKAVYTSAFYSGLWLDATDFGFVAVPTPDTSLADLESAVDEVLAQFLANGVDQVAFDRIKRQLRADEVYGRDDTNGLAREYGASLTSGLTVADVQAWPDILQAVTPDDVMTAAREVLNRGNAVTGWLQRQDASQTKVTQ